MSFDKRISMIVETSQTYHLDIEDITVQPMVLLQDSVSQQKICASNNIGNIHEIVLNYHLMI